MTDTRTASEILATRNQRRTDAFAQYDEARRLAESRGMTLVALGMRGIGYVLTTKHGGVGFDPAAAKPKTDELPHDLAIEIDQRESRMASLLQFVAVVGSAVSEWEPQL